MEWCSLATPSHLARLSELLGRKVDILEGLEGAHHGPDVREARRAEEVLRHLRVRLTGLGLEKRKRKRI